jgi:hypothetical protein
MFRRYRLISQANMGVFRFTYSYDIIIFENGTIGWLIIRFFELKFYYTLIYILNYYEDTFLRIFTFSYIS